MADTVLQEQIKNTKIIKLLGFFCVGVMYSGEYDACDVTMSVYPHRGIEPY